MISADRRTFHPDSVRLENIYVATESLNVSKDEASAIVGGAGILKRLIAAGAIRAEKRSRSQNGKWFCNMADVLRHSRCANK